MESLIIRAGDPLPGGVSARSIAQTSQIPVRLDVDLGNPAESTLQPIATRTGILH
jgi:hypothetical protein